MKKKPSLLHYILAWENCKQIYFDLTMSFKIQVLCFVVVSVHYVLQKYVYKKDGALVKRTKILEHVVSFGHQDKFLYASVYSEQVVSLILSLDVKVFDWAWLSYRIG